MSSTLVKSKLKAAREALQARDYVKAEQAASDALTFESSNYNARVFLAVAKLNLGKHEESEQAYQTAIGNQPETLLAWQGLASFYEKLYQWPKYVETQRKLADLAKAAQDAAKCAEALQKILNTQREHGSDADKLDALKLFLPSSVYYDTLSMLPPPDATNPSATTTYEAQTLIHNSLPIYEELLADEEAKESAAITAELARRRQRLTTTTSAEDTRRSVMREVMTRSKLPSLYTDIMQHHMAGDDLRRETENKLLQYQYDLLRAWPDPFANAPQSAVTEEARANAEREAKLAAREKDKLRGILVDIAAGMTTLRLPNELAWAIRLEWADMKDAADFDVYQLKRYIELYPEEGLSRLAILELNLTDPLKDATTKETKLSLEEWSSQIDAAFEAAQDKSVKAHVLASTIYLRQKDYELVADVAEAGLSALERLQGEIGMKLPGISFILQVHLAIALVHLNPPSHHLRALRILNPLLEQSPDNLQCALAKAYIHQYAERWQEAFDLFSRVYEHAEDDAVKFEALREEAWCLGNIEGRSEEALEELHEVAVIMDPKAEFHREEKAQAWWRYGVCLAKLKDSEHQQAAYEAFITSIKRDNVYAPAFSALGNYFLTGIDPPDKDRAIQCFQKAFELDNRQDEAARLLAEDYAENDDWDLVESVARRVVSNITLLARRGASAAANTDAMSSGSYTAVKIAWAWKAIGAAELKAKHFPQAITALQSALRGAQDDVNIWVQLAMAYRGAGKHVAALKTLVRVTTMALDNWHAVYLIGDIQRQMGLFQPAIDNFEKLYNDRPEELAIKVALAETYLLLAHSETRAGFTYRAFSNVSSVLSLGLTFAAGENAAPRIAWKLIGDGLLMLSKLVIEDTDEADQEGSDAADVRAMLQQILQAITTEDIDTKNPLLQAVTCKLLTDEKMSEIASTSSACLVVAVLSYSLRMLYEGKSGSGRGSAWYDLGQALFLLRPVYASLGLDTKQDEKDVTMQSIQCLRNALQREPMNGNFWNLMGILSLDTSPKLAQHSFIRAVELNSRSATPWTNLGLFYLRNDDIQLANKAFLRAQIIDPDYAQAWLGQAALAQINGETAQAEALIAHAASFGNGAVPEAELAFALHSYETFKNTRRKKLREGDSLNDPTPSHAAEYISHPQFLVSRFKASHTTSATAAHLHGLLSEQLDQYSLAVKSFSHAVTTLEAEYEISESAEVERRYILANISLARSRLATEDYEGVVSAVEAAEALLGEDDVQDLEEEVMILLTQCRLLKALACHFQGDIEMCLELFEGSATTLAEYADTHGSPSDAVQSLKAQATILHAKALYASDDAAHKEAAEKLLLKVADADDATKSTPSPLLISALGALVVMAERSQNGASRAAALSRLDRLPIDVRFADDVDGDLSALESLRHAGDDVQQQQLQHALHANPAASGLAADQGNDDNDAMHRRPWRAHIGTG